MVIINVYKAKYDTILEKLHQKDPFFNVDFIRNTCFELFRGVVDNALHY